MKITEQMLRKLVRKIANRPGSYLCEIANRVGDLPDDVFVVAEYRMEYDGIAVYFGDATGKPSNIIEGEVSAQLTSYDRKNRRRAFAVQEASAPDGWGPILYDVAMEMATLLGEALTSDIMRGTTPLAKRVWDYYYYSRDDVTRELYRESRTPSLHAIYRKQPVTLRKLGQTGHLVVIGDKNRLFRI